jgi:hypothetical protein
LVLKRAPGSALTHREQRFSQSRIGDGRFGLNQGGFNKEKKGEFQKFRS